MFEIQKHNANHFKVVIQSVYVNLKLENLTAYMNYCDIETQSADMNYHVIEAQSRNNLMYYLDACVLMTSVR